MLRAIVLLPLLSLACAQPEGARAPFTMGEQQSSSFAGALTELVPAGGYLYALVETEHGPRWVASLKKPLVVGEPVHVRVFAEREDFHSKRTGRRFGRLYFGLITQRSQS